MINKSKLLNSLKELPDFIDLTDLLDRIMLLEKIDIGLAQGGNNETLTTNEAKNKLKKWLK